jgi:hypothetical protein
LKVDSQLKVLPREEIWDGKIPANVKEIIFQTFASHNFPQRIVSEQIVPEQMQYANRSMADLLKTNIRFAECWLTSGGSAGKSVSAACPHVAPIRYSH